jgi:transposase
LDHGAGKVLEDANLKLSSVATDLQGVTAQAILRAVVAGQEDPKLLAELAKGTLRKKRGELQRAMVGRMSEHHRFLLAQLLTQVDFLDEQIGQLEERMDALLEKYSPFQEAAERLDTIPGVNRQLAILIVSEIGVDMSRFPTDRHLVAWAGVAPGNNETGGKQRSGKARKGNRHLTTGLVLAAHAASNQKNTYLRALFYRLAARRGKQRAAVAVGRTILQMAYYMLKRQEVYRELGASYLDQLDRERTAKRLVKRLVALGYEVQMIAPIAPREEMDRKPTDPPLPLAG